MQQFYNSTDDLTCSNQYIRTTAHALDTCIVRGPTSTKYSANSNGDTDFYICVDDVCGNCTKYVIASARCQSTPGQLLTTFNTKSFPDHFLPRYYILSVTYEWGTEECLGDAEVVYITPGSECTESCDADVQQFCSEFPKEIIDGVPLPTSSPPPTTPTVSGPWVVAEYYKEPSCSEFAFAHLFELNVCMSPPNSEVSSVYRLGADGNVHEYQCHDAVCGYCKDFGVPPGYKGCAREDAHDLPVRKVDVSHIPHLRNARVDDDPSNFTYYYLNTYVSNIFPAAIKVDSTVIVYYQGYVDEGHVCGGSVDHIIVTPHYAQCEEICVYGLQFFCEVPQFLEASGVPTSLPTGAPTSAPDNHTGKKGSGATVAVVLVLLTVAAAAGIGGFLFYKRKLVGGKIGRYSLLNINREAADEEEDGGHL